MEQSFTSAVLPEDYKDNIVRMKKELRSKINDLEGLFKEVSDKIENEINEINALKEKGHTAWPVISYADIAAGNVSQDTLQNLKKRGCLVVKGHFAREQALNWDKSMVDYLDSNNFDAQYRGPGDNFFGTLEASKPEIFPIYWSHAQMEARQDERMANVQSFLNKLWKFESNGKTWFDPDTNITYPDRIRHRRPGTTSKGLGAHTDSGALERWLLPAYQKVFRNLFTNHFDEYDPWDAAYRTEVDEYDVPNTTKCSAFRTFQGWTALSDMEIGQGLLHVVPIPVAMAYVLLRPLLNDVPEDELCGVAPGRVLPVSEKWHPLLMKGLSSIPSLEAGDSVWWHCDVIHSVAPVENQRGWGNVMYIPAAPMCEKNLAYARSVAQALSRGESPNDFPKEDYEANWNNRFKVENLNTIGKKSLGMKS
ncbi:DUF1479 domain-containing protein [Pantoea sp. B65]|uniref:DUF1479 domain-containing protein n=1 Tax=Pantoea sp. B65 TaxID=2813359 RepID=UPI0039B41EF7